MPEQHEPQFVLNLDKVLGRSGLMMLPVLVPKTRLTSVLTMAGGITTVGTLRTRVQFVKVN